MSNEIREPLPPSKATPVARSLRQSNKNLRTVIAASHVLSTGMSSPGRRPGQKYGGSGMSNH